MLDQSVMLSGQHLCCLFHFGLHILPSLINDLSFEVLNLLLHTHLDLSHSVIDVHLYSLLVQFIQCE